MYDQIVQMQPKAHTYAHVHIHAHIQSYKHVHTHTHTHTREPGPFTRDTLLIIHIHSYHGGVLFSSEVLGKEKISLNILIEASNDTVNI